MAFQFQINRDIEFNHDETLLNKADALTPVMIHKTKHPVSMGKLVRDNSKLEGWTVEKDDAVLENCEYKKDDVFILDFGDHCVGKFSIDINSVGSPMDAPLYFRIRFAEVPAELSHESSEYDGWLARGWIQEEFVHLDELPVHFEMPRRYSFRYVEIKVIDTSPKWSAVFSNPTVVTESCVDKTAAAPVNLEDEMLERIYNVGLKTLEDCMTDIFEDGPKRDRRLWLGDLRLQAKANYVTFDQKDLVKRCLYLFGGMTTKDGRISANVFVKPKLVPDDSFLYDYSLFFVSALYDYLQEHNEKELLEDLFPIAKKQIEYTLSYIEKTGEVAADEKYPVFVDWSNEFNKDTCRQAIMIYVFKQFISLCKEIKEDTAKYEDALNKMTEYAVVHLFDRERNLFKTTNDEYNIASQVWMVLAGVLTPEENKSLMETTIRELFPVKNVATPYMYHHIAEAMFIAGLNDEAISFGLISD